MTALPTIAYLRRHALPAHVLASLQGGRPVDISPTRSARPALVATWHIGADNRPASLPDPAPWALTPDPPPAPHLPFASAVSDGNQKPGTGT